MKDGKEVKNMLTVGEIHRDECKTAALRTIAKEMERANKLKALELRCQYGKVVEEPIMVIFAK